MIMKKAILVLEGGTVIRGSSFGAVCEVYGESAPGNPLRMIS